MAGLADWQARYRRLVRKALKVRAPGSPLPVPCSIASHKEAIEALRDLGFKVVFKGFDDGAGEYALVTKAEE
jgi:hypothetical protein